MSKNNALVSGSFALQLFERVYWEESDLDIFVKYDSEADSMGKYLVDVESYTLVKTNEVQYDWKIRIILQVSSI
jgi:hypothetical protein